MQQGDRNNPMFNASGCPDPTAYKAVKAVSKSEKAVDEVTAVENKVGFLIKILKYIIRESGFELVNRIELKDSKSGRIFR